MSVPDLVRQRLDDEPVDASVSLGNDDELVVTPSRTMVYRGEGLIRDATVEEYPHEAEAVAVSEGRRKSSILLQHGLEGDKELAVPADRLEDILPSVLRGVLRTNDVIGGDETVRDVFRLGELSLIVCDDRLLKHVGDGVWDEDAEAFRLAAVTALDVEEGEVSSQIIVELDGRPERIKVPTEDARVIRERIEAALLEHHGVDDYTTFVRQHGTADAETAAEPEPTEPASATEGESSGIEFGSGDGVTDSIDLGEDRRGSSPDGDREEIAAEVAELREAVERQNELLETHERTIQQLIEELRNL